jgi:release factor glutamine methyltransferase
LLLAHVLHCDRTKLLLKRLTTVSEQAEGDFTALVAQRMAGVPVAYLTGTREFMGLPFRVGPGVLVPRPETELLVEWALSWLRSIARNGPVSIVDVGTGSGAIACAMAKLVDLQRLQIVASDRSTTALDYARLNRDTLELRDRVHLVAGNLVDWLSGPVDLVLANLPYLRPDQIEGNRAISAEPRLALDGGTTGLDLIGRLVHDLPRVLSSGSAVALEIDPSQSEALRTIVRQVMGGTSAEFHRDLAGWDRFATIECP